MYSKRAFVHWYVGEGMEEVCLDVNCTKWLLMLNFFSRVNFLRLAKIWPHLRKTMKRLVLTLPTLRRMVNTKGYNVEFSFSSFPFTLKYPFSTNSRPTFLSSFHVS